MTEQRSALAELASRFPGRLSLGTRDEERDDPFSREDRLGTGLPALDARLGGLPRGRLSELIGPASSGKLSVLLSTLRRVLAPPAGEPGLAALVDLSGSVFPRGAWASGRLLVVRPRELSEALRAFDLLASSASFEAVALEASGRVPERGLPEAVTVRLARIARETGTSLLACAERSVFGALTSLRLQLDAAPDGTLRAAVSKSRGGPLGRATIERPGLPWAIASSLRALREEGLAPASARAS